MTNIKENILKEIERLNKNIIEMEKINEEEAVGSHTWYLRETSKAQLKICDEYEKKIQEFVDKVKDKWDGTCMALNNEDDIRLRNVLKNQIDKLAKEHFGLKTYESTSEAKE